MRRFAFVVLAFLPACLLTSNLDRLSRDYGSDDGAAPSNPPGPSNDAGGETGATPPPGASGTYCAGFFDAGKVLFCDDFDDGRSDLLGRWESVNTNARGEALLDDSLFRSAPRSLHSTLAAGSGSSIGALATTVEFPSGKLHVHFAMLLPQDVVLQSFDTFVLKVAFADSVEVNLTIGGDFGTRIVERGGQYQEESTALNPKKGAWTDFDLHIDVNAKRVFLDVGNQNAVSDRALKNGPFQTHARVDIGIAETQITTAGGLYFDDIAILEDP